MPEIIEREKSLRELNWWKVGGHAEFFAAPRTVEELSEVWSWAHEQKLKIHILSGGSNVLIQEGLIKGLVLSLHELKGVESAGGMEAESEQSKASGGEPVSLRKSESGREDVRSGTAANVQRRFQVVCLAGTPKSEVARHFLQQKLWPAVFLTGIPGDMGGGVVMNAGIGEMIKPREFCEIVEWVEVMRPIAGAALPNLDVSGAESSAQNECESRTPPTKTNASVGAPVPAKTAPNIERIPATQINWAYRHSSGWQPGVIIRVAVGWSLEPDQEVLSGVRAATKKRVSTQPLNKPSGGSTFRNPPGLKAAKLIDECGLKGFRIGGAVVSDKHANFLVNEGDATANDIHQLICYVRETVKRKKGVELQTEVVYLGDWPDCIK